MTLTEKKTNLLSAITLVVFKNKWEKREFVKENVKARAIALKNLYKSSPQKLISLANLYHKKLTNDEVSETWIEILQLYIEMRGAELNS